MEKARGIGPVSYAKPHISVYMCLYFVFACLTVFLLIFATLPSSRGTEVYVYDGDVKDPQRLILNVYCN